MPLLVGESFDYWQHFEAKRELQCCLPDAIHALMGDITGASAELSIGSQMF